MGVKKVDPFHPRPEVRPRQIHNLESLLMCAPPQFAAGWGGNHLRVAALTQPSSQREQSLLSSPEAGPGIDVDDRERVSIFSLLRRASREAITRYNWPCPST